MWSTLSARRRRGFATIFSLLVVAEAFQYPLRRRPSRIVRSGTSFFERTQVDLDDAATQSACDVANEAATLLRDGFRDGSLVKASRKVLAMVSSRNNAANLKPNQFARSVEENLPHYRPLLSFATTQVASAAVSTDGGTATVRLELCDARGQRDGTAVWSLSRADTTERWLIDAVLVQNGVTAREEAVLKEETASFTADYTSSKEDDAPSSVPIGLSSPRWVTSTVLKALRDNDRPHRNAGCECAIRFCSEDNPSSSLPPEIFRQYLEDESYPYGILLNWKDMKAEEVIFDEDKQRASHDVALFDDAGDERRVTIKLSRSKKGDWLIDSVWCPE